MAIIGPVDEALSFEMNSLYEVEKIKNSWEREEWNSESKMEHPLSIVFIKEISEFGPRKVFQKFWDVTVLIRENTITSGSLTK